MNVSKLTVLVAIIALAACSESVTKKVMIIGRGSIKVSDNNVTMSGSSGSVEETVDVAGNKPVTWNVETPTGKTTVNIPEEKGFYVLNLKTDTLVGSLQNIGADLGGRTISQEELKIKIDSLNKLITGSNVSFGGHNYFVLPNQLIKITSNMEAKVYGPFNKIPGTLEVDKNGNQPEIYKFYTNSEMRELIGNLKKMTF